MILLRILTYLSRCQSSPEWRNALPNPLKNTAKKRNKTTTPINTWLDRAVEGWMIYDYKGSKNQRDSQIFEHLFLSVFLLAREGFLTRKTLYIILRSNTTRASDFLYKKIWMPLIKLKLKNYHITLIWYVTLSKSMRQDRQLNLSRKEYNISNHTLLLKRSRRASSSLAHPKRLKNRK